MHFDHTKKIYGFKKRGSASALEAVIPERAGELSELILESDVPVADDPPLEIKVGDRLSFENLLRDQIQLHDVIAASSATPVSGTASEVANMLAAVEIEETCAEVEAAFREIDETDDWNNRETVDSGAPDDEYGDERITVESEASVGQVAGDTTGDTNDDADFDDMETPKPLQSVARVPIENLADKDRAVLLQDVSCRKSNGKGSEIAELSPNDLEVFPDGESDNGDMVVFSDARSTEKTPDGFAEAERIIIAPTSEPALSAQPHPAPMMTRYTLTGLPASDDDLQIVRTSLPPSPEMAARSRRNPWKTIALFALFLLAVLLGWTLHGGNFSFLSEKTGSLSLLHAGGGETLSVPPLVEQDHSGTVSNGRDDALAVTVSLSDDGADLHSNGTAVAYRQWRRTDVENPRREAGAARDRDADKRKQNGEAANRDGRKETTDAKRRVTRDVDERTGAAPGEDVGDEVAVSAVKKGRYEEEDAQVPGVIPERPTEDEVRAAMKEVRPYIESCRFDTPGKLILKMTVSGASGKIISSEVIDDTFRGTSTGRCAVRAVQKARLPIFQKNQIIIKYPFNL